MSKRRQRDTVETPLTATSLWQRPPFFVPADKKSIHRLLFKTSLQRPSLYNDHFLLYPRCALQRGSTVCQTREGVLHLISKHREVICQTSEKVFHRSEFKSSGRLLNAQMVEVFNPVTIYYTCCSQNGDYTLTDHSLDSSWHFILKYALAFAFLHQSCKLRQAIYPSGRWRAWTRGNWRWWRRWWARPEKNTPVIIVSIY